MKSGTCNCGTGLATATVSVSIRIMAEHRDEIRQVRMCETCAAKWS